MSDGEKQQIATSVLYVSTGIPRFPQQYTLTHQNSDKTGQLREGGQCGWWWHRLSFCSNFLSRSCCDPTEVVTLRMKTVITSSNEKNQDLSKELAYFRSHWKLRTNPGAWHRCLTCYLMEIHSKSLRPSTLFFSPYLLYLPISMIPSYKSILLSPYGSSCPYIRHKVYLELSVLSASSTTSHCSQNKLWQGPSRNHPYVFPTPYPWACLHFLPLFCPNHRK